MTIYYSSNPRGFYDEHWHGDRIPEASKPLTLERYHELIDGQAQGKLIREDADGNPVLVDPPAAADTAETLCEQIDQAAATARVAVVGDHLRAVEYDRTAAEAQAFKDAGYPADTVPRAVAAWAINGRNAQQAADDILAQSARCTEALYGIREIRLLAKEQVRSLWAVGDLPAAEQVAADAVAELEAMLYGEWRNLD